MTETTNQVSSGIEGLDEILDGGFPRDSLILIQGEPGTGKTTAALQFMAAGRERGERILFVSLSQTRDELERVARSHGIDLTDIHIECMDSLTSDKERSFSVDTNEATLVDLMAHVHHSVESTRPSLMVFDSLLELRLLSPDPVAYRSEVLKLRHYLAIRSVTALLIDHVETAGLDRQVEGIAHGCVVLEANAPPIGITERRLRVTKLRGQPFREGFHDFRIVEGGLSVFPRIVPALSPSDDMSQMPLGVETLDRMLGGGLEFGTNTLVVGQAGTGKSTLSTLIALAVAERGRKAALFLFEERPEVYRERSKGVGLDIHAFEQDGTVRLHQYDPTEISAGEFCQHVVTCVEEDGVECVVLDSISGYLIGMPQRQNLVTHLHSLLQYLARKGVMVGATLAQHGLLGEPPRSDLDTSYLADSIILLRHYASGAEIRRSIAVLKKRHSAHERKIEEFVIAPGEVSVKQMSDEAAAKQKANSLVGGP